MTLEGLSQEQREYISSLNKQIEKLTDELSWLKKQVFGQKSERLVMPEDPSQANLFGLSPEPKASETITVSYERKTKGHGRREIKNELPVIERVEVDLENKACSDCGKEMNRIGEETVRELVLVPAKLGIKEIVRIKRACGEHPECGIQIARSPKVLQDKSPLSPSILAQIVGDKYVNHLPLERQSKNFERMGFPISNGLLCEWLQVVDPLLERLFGYLKEKLIKREVLFSDDTSLAVVDKDKPGKTHRGFIWLYSDGSEIAIFDYRKGRGKDCPIEFLKGFKGFLHSDAYAGYNALYSSGNVTPVLCWSHARRGFYEAVRSGRRLGSRPLGLINRLFRIERIIKSYSIESKLEIRERVSGKVTETLYKWCSKNGPPILPESTLGKAIGYLHNHKSGLLGYLKDGRLEISNNLSERNIRPCVIGRKNWLFSGNHEAAQRACRYYTLVATCKMLKVDPYAYFNWVFEEYRQNPEQLPQDLVPSAYPN